MYKIRMDKSQVKNYLDYCVIILALSEIFIVVLQCNVSVIYHKFKEYRDVYVKKDTILQNEYPVRTIVEAMEADLLQNIPEARMLGSKM
jgi:hypothetical protein